ncbi:uncharacterized protein LOC135198645 isoform X2 [Macrobrachium nipponense]|uniref:uncharacterized protein LOC135198645 isoform X2 n=1 Tax=Macrobrachium nipponense TaxID=159736 RepID=UPI0030C7D274
MEEVSKRTHVSVHSEIYPVSFAAIVSNAASSGRVWLMVNHIHNRRSISTRLGLRGNMVKGKRRTNRNSKDENSLVNAVDGPKGPKEPKTFYGSLNSSKANNLISAVTRKKETKITSYFSPSRSPPAADDAEGTPGETLANGSCGLDLEFSSAQLTRPVSSSAPTTPTRMVNGTTTGMSSTVSALITPPKRTVCTRSQALKELQLQPPKDISSFAGLTKCPLTVQCPVSTNSPSSSLGATSGDEGNSLHTGPPTPHKIQALNEEVLRLDSPLSPSSALSKLKLSMPTKKLVFNGKTTKARRKLPTQAPGRIPSQPKSEKAVKTETSTVVTNGEAKPVLRDTQMTEFFQIRRSRRKPKTTLLQERQKEIEERILNSCEDGLKVENFGAKGRGVITTRRFAKGEFVVEYIGDLIDMKEAKDREKLYAQDASKGCYNYYFTFQNQQYCIDATEETGYLGRLVNHSRNGNLVPKAVEVNGRPHLILLAKTDLPCGTEILYDYGDRSKESLQHHPWLAL